mmetsp:Transcript_5894/g.15101  ORF Transcript_5894/g.15101 Transcript_5894/m.15101 type:complete len:399 (+) Transcript_5894:2-1198(+)
MGRASGRALAPLGSATAKATGQMKGASARALSTASAAAGSAVARLGDEMPTLDLELAAPELPPRPCWLKCLCACPSACFSCVTCGCCPAACREPCRAAVARAMEVVSVRVSVTPALLLLSWGLLRGTIAALLDFMGVVAMIWTPIFSFVLPYAAVAMSLCALAAQAYFVSLPIARGLAHLAFELPEMVANAFDQLLVMLPNTLTALVVALGVPERLVTNIVKALFSPLQQALHEVMELIPNVDEVLPAWCKRATPLVPLVCGGLLTGLFFGQALVFLMVGMNGMGDFAILFCLMLCGLLAMMAVYADRIVPILLWLTETVINVVVQFLLRRVLAVEKLQRGIDMALRGVELGAKMAMAGASVGEGAIVRAAKPALDRASVPMLHGSLTKQINSGIASA